MTIDLNDYVAGGYFIAKYRKWRYPSSGLLPDQVLSISNCQGNLLPVYYGWKSDIDQQYALDFGIPAEKLPAFSKWSYDKRKVEIGYPDVFYDLSTVRQFIAQFLPANDDLFTRSGLIPRGLPRDCVYCQIPRSLLRGNSLLIGVGLHNTLVDRFLNDNKHQIALDVKLDFYERLELDPAEQFGIDRLLSLRKRLPSGGIILGFDVVWYTTKFSCSWLCLTLEYELNEKFCIRANSIGLLDSLEDAQMAHSLVLDDEDLPYYPFLIVQYPLV